jgi:protein-S-isoprenylcysteine O-methyltransferase Ste14
LSKFNRTVKKHRTKISGVFGILCFILAKPTLNSLIAGAIPILIGQSIRIWSSGHIHKNQILTVTGPYSLSRNPLYVGSFILGTGFMIGMGVIWLTVVFLLFYSSIYWFTIKWEEEKLGKKFADDWIQYRRAVPRFLPFFRIPHFSPGEFSWSQVTKHKEIQNASVVLAVYGILWGKALLMG